MQHYRWGRSIIIGICLVLLTSGGLLTIVGSGGGGGDDPDPVGAVRFMNDLICGGRAFSARLTMGGRSINAMSGRWSGCMNFPPNTYSAEVFFVACGRSFRGTVNIPVQDQCTTNVKLTIRSGRFFIEYPRACPGVCISGKAEDATSSETSATAYEEIIFDEPLQKFDLEAFEVVEKD